MEFQSFIYSILAVIVIATTTIVTADLKSDLRDFRTLIPRRRISNIVARHLIVDERFRKASDFVRSSEFMTVWAEIRDSDEVIQIFDFLSESVPSGIDIEEIVDGLPNTLRGYRIPSRVPVNMMVDRNVATFLRDVVRALPRGRINNMVTRKVRENGDFAKLYKALKSPEFKELVNNARNSTNLEAPIETLAKNSINVDDVIDAGYTILSWGP